MPTGCYSCAIGVDAEGCPSSCARYFFLQTVELRQLPLREPLSLRLKVAADHGQGVFQHLQACRGQRHRNFAPVLAAGGALNQPLAAQLVGQARDVGGFFASRITWRGAALASAWGAGFYYILKLPLSYCEAR